MKLAKKITPKAMRRARLKNFSKHWLDAVKLSDVSVLASSDDSSGGAGAAGAIYFQVSPFTAIAGIGAYISPWNTTNPSSNPPIFNYSNSYIMLATGGHFGTLSIQHTGGGSGSAASDGSWQTVAVLDGSVVASCAFDYNGSNASYLEIDVDSSGNWTFWGDFGSMSQNPGSSGYGGVSIAQFGCQAGEGDYLMYNCFSNCALNFGGGSNGWTAPNFVGMTPSGSPNYQAVDAEEDSVLFQDSPPY